jgi:hypothetical protein
MYLLLVSFPEGKFWNMDHSRALDGFWWQSRGACSKTLKILVKKLYRNETESSSKA